MGSARIPALGLCVVVACVGLGGVAEAAQSTPDSMGSTDARLPYSSRPAADSAVRLTAGVTRSMTRSGERRRRPKPGARCKARQQGQIVATVRFGKLQCKKGFWRAMRPANPVPSPPVPPTWIPSPVPMRDSDPTPSPSSGTAPSPPSHPSNAPLAPPGDAVSSPDPARAPAQDPEPVPSPTTSSSPSPATSTPVAPIPFTADVVFSLNSAQSNYWIYAPSAYDPSHAKPITLFVWMHGCGGQGRWDIYQVSPGESQNFISIALGGREGACWDVNSDTALVLAAIADVKTHVNINPHRVVLGGYSSGGNLAYRTAFYNADTIAGVLAENTAPFTGTGSSQSASMSAAAWRFPIVHLAHTQDAAYPISRVRDEMNALTTAGFPVTLMERPGGHWVDDTADTGTNHDLRTLLLPHLDADWRSP